MLRIVPGGIKESFIRTKESPSGNSSLEATGAVSSFAAGVSACPMNIGIPKEPAESAVSTQTQGACGRNTDPQFAVGADRYIAFGIEPAAEAKSVRYCDIAFAGHCLNNIILSEICISDYIHLLIEQNTAAGLQIAQCTNQTIYFPRFRDNRRMEPIPSFPLWKG